MQDTLPSKLLLNKHIQVYKDIFPLKGSRKKVNNEEIISFCGTIWMVLMGKWFSLFDYVCI